MSTYLDNAPTYLPTVQPYEPNFQLYAGALEFKQTKYDTNSKIKIRVKGGDVD